ncbi:hypothetical protein ABPG72_003127 [Tetrahymena utriculariae]
MIQNCPSFPYCASCNQSTCLNCKAGYTLQNNCCQANNSILDSIMCDLDPTTPKCLDDQYLLQNQCFQCPTGCLTCTSQNNCQSCDQNQNYYKSQSSGVCQQCMIQQGYFVSIIDNSCQQCFPGCSSCNGSKQYQCLTCQEGFFFNTGFCIQQITNCDSIIQNTCQKCSKGYYLDSNQLCAPCSKGCLACQSDQSCQECDKVNNYYLNSPNGICQFCNTSQGWSIINDTCQQCFTGCSPCNGTLQQNCITCSDNYYLDKGTNTCLLILNCDSIQQNSCLKCKDGYYINSYNVCSPCPAGCLTCQSPQSCQTCGQAKNYYFSQSSQICNICNTSQGYFISGQYCLECFNGCSQCFGPMQQNCLACKDGQYLQNNTCLQILNCDQIQNNSCLKCKDGYYMNSISICSLCPTGCLTCESEKICKTCDVQNKYAFLDNLKTTCQLCQQPGQFILIDQCTRCSQVCAECNGSSNNCTSCKDDYNFDEKKMTCFEKIQNCGNQIYDTCQKCDDGYYLSTSSKCTQCPQGCLICTSDKQCQKCDVINNCAFQDDQTICSKCLVNNGYFIQNGKCSKCHFTCDSCNGTSQSDCLICNQGFILEKNSNICVCQGQNQIVDIFQKKCVCKQGFVLDGENCQDKCSKQKYNNNGVCQSCDSSCSSCKGSKGTDCLSCHKGFVLLPNIGSCGLCEEGQFYNNSTKNCDYCDYTCIQCTGQDKSQCITCTDGLMLSNVTNTCELSSQIKSEQQQLNQYIQIGCYNQTQQNVDQNCYQIFEESLSKTKTLEILAIINMILISISSYFTSFGSSIGLIFFQNQQLMSNYLFFQNLNTLWINQLELKVSYAHHLFTMIPNFFKQSNNTDNILLSLNNYNTYIPLNDFYKSSYDNCLQQVSVIGFCLSALTIFSCLNKIYGQQSLDSRITRIYYFIKWNVFVNVFRNISCFLALNCFFYFYKQEIKLDADLFIVIIFIVFYIPLHIFWVFKVSCQYYQIPFNQISQFQYLVQEIETGKPISRIFWMIYEFKKVAITLTQSFFLLKGLNQQMLCWIHVGLNSIFILYIVVQKPFIKKLDCYSVIAQEIISTSAVVFLAIIFLDKNLINYQEISELSQIMHKSFKIAMFAYVGVSIFIQAYYITQKIIIYVQNYLLIQQQKSNQITNKTSNTVQQITEQDIEKLFGILDYSNSNRIFRLKKK